MKIGVNFAWSVALFFLIVSIGITIYYNNKIENIKTGIAIDTISSVLETSNHTKSIYVFAKNQYDQGLIQGSSLSNQIQQVISTYDKLIAMVKTKGTSKKSKELSDLTIQMLNLEKEGYSNLKSAIDFNADNFNKAAEQKFNEATELSNKIANAIGNYLAKNSSNKSNLNNVSDTNNDFSMAVSVLY